MRTSRRAAAWWEDKKLRRHLDGDEGHIGSCIRRLHAGVWRQGKSIGGTEYVASFFFSASVSVSERLLAEPHAALPATSHVLKTPATSDMNRASRQKRRLVPLQLAGWLAGL